MDIEKIKKEISSDALSEITGSLGKVVERIKGGQIGHQQGSAEIAGHKHIIQTIALDWLYSGCGNKKIRSDK